MDEANLQKIGVYDPTATDARDRLAQAVIDTFRVQFEAPQRAGGVPYSRIVADYAEIARRTLPAFLNALGVIMRRHIVVAASGKWYFDQESAVTKRDLVVGFADL